MDQKPTVIGAAISACVKAVLVALIAIKVVPWDDGTATAVALAVAAIVDTAVMLGLIRPRVTPIANPRDKDGKQLIPIGARQTDGT